MYTILCRGAFRLFEKFLVVTHPKVTIGRPGSSIFKERSDYISSFICLNQWYSFVFGDGYWFYGLCNWLLLCIHQLKCTIVS